MFRSSSYENYQLWEAEISQLHSATKAVSQKIESVRGERERILVRLVDLERRCRRSHSESHEDPVEFNTGTTEHLLA
jgi:hypothetical protein